MAIWYDNAINTLEGSMIHGPLDPSGKILPWTQIEHSKSDCHHALWTICRHWSGDLVHSSPEDRPDMVGKWNVSIYALVDDHDPCMLCLCLTNPFLCTPLSSSSSTFHSAKIPSTSTYTIWRNTYGCKCSPENALFTSVRSLLVQRDQLSCEKLPPPFGRLEINHRAKEEID